ncbi:MAG: hypothetical protein PF489_10330 [Salinivirgaceae bacterium]|nr:hypothetical protein [Salinivirgaceae bacterium]
MHSLSMYEKYQQLNTSITRYGIFCVSGGLITAYFRVSMENVFV